MLPVKKRMAENGAIEEVQPLEELWNRLYLPPEFYQMLAHVEELSSEFITPDAVAMFSQMKGPLLDGLKSMFHATVQDILRRRLLQFVQTVIEKVTVPAQLDKFMADNILPALNRQLVKAFVEQELGMHLKQFAPLFHKLATESAEAEPENRKRIEDALIEEAKKKFHHFKEAQFHAVEIKEKDRAALLYEPLSQAEWAALVAPLVEHSKQTILASSINGIPFSPMAASVKDVEEILKKTLLTVDPMNDPFYGNLADDLLSKLGGFPLYFKDTVSSALTRAVAEMRESHHYLTELITDSLKDILLDKEYVSSLISNQPAPSPALVPQKLAHQIQTTASIAHDLIMRKAESQGGTLFKYMAQKFVLTDSPTLIEGVVKRIYQKLFGREILNQNAVIRSIDELFASFSFASQQIQNRENLEIHQLALNLSQA